MDDVNDKLKEIEKIIKREKRESDNRIKELNKQMTQQPFIKFDNINIYFKIPRDINFKLLNNNTLELEYHYHNAGQIPKAKELDLNELADRINNYINAVEQTQIIKSIELQFNRDLNSNFNGDYYFEDSLINQYISNFLNDKYNSYQIINSIKEASEMINLYIAELTNNGKKTIEYFLFINVFCINFTMDNYCNLEMKNLISKILLTASFTKEINDELIYNQPIDEQLINSIYLDVPKSQLKLAFEINDNNVNSINTNVEVPSMMHNSVSIIENNNINSQLQKFNNLILNYPKIKNDDNFIRGYAFNFLLLGNESLEKETVLNYIKNTFSKSKIFGTELSIYELNLKYDINTTKDLETFKKKILNTDVVYIKHFDYIDSEFISIITETLLDLAKDNILKSIIISGDKEKSLEILKSVQALLDIFSFKFYFEDYSIDRLFKLLIDKIDTNKYTINLDEVKTKKIMNSLLVKSKEKNDAFVNKIYTYMYRYILENNKQEFDLLCLPNLDAQSNNNSIEYLNNLIGLNEVKEKVQKLVSFWKYKEKIKDITNSNVNDGFLNMFFTGNPGTGKTTVARIISNILYELGYIKENKFIEITPNDLVGDYVGQTKTVTKEILCKAKNGLLFVDEAYLFSNDNQFFKEALVELLKYLENPKNVVIFAGYADSMENVLNLNSGLKSRIAYYIDFKDYNVDELILILKYKVKKNGLQITDNAIQKLIPFLEEQIKIKDFGNARYIDKLFTNLLMKHSENMETNYNEEDLLIIRGEDVDLEELKNDKIQSKNSFGFIKKNGDEV